MKLALPLLRLRREASEPAQRLTRRECIHFCLHLSQLLAAGLSILEALTQLADDAERPVRRALFADIAAQVGRGRTLSAALRGQRGVFPELLIQLVQAGECSGRVDHMLEHHADSLKWEDELAGNARRLLIYPCFALAIVGVATVFLMFEVIPQLEHFIRGTGQPLPWSSRLLFACAALLRAYWPLLLACLALLAFVLVVAYRRHPAAPRLVDRLILALPGLGKIAQKLGLARVAATLAQLYAAGIPLLDALRMIEGIAGNRVLAASFRRVAARVRHGSPLSAACRAEPQLPPFFAGLLASGERSGDLARSLDHLAYFYTRDVHEAVGRLQAAIEPLLTLALGLLLGWIMTATLGPLYDTIGNFRV
jgi:type IV pilus assembly protein PilC